MISARRESQDRYHLNLSSTPIACIVSESPTLLHNHLSHPSLLKRRKMVPGIFNLESFNCKSYQLGKHSYNLFLNRVNRRATFLFELVHSNMWGLCRVSSILGFQNFVTFIDNNSCCNWLLLMKSCLKLHFIFESFCVDIKTQFNIVIRVLRSDNAYEYFFAPFTKFMTSRAIFHQSSCTYTSQQNKVVERKNRHFIETVRTLLLHNQVPSSFGRTMCWLLVSWLIECLLQSYQTRYFILFCSLISGYTLFPTSLVTCTLSIFIPLIKIN